MGDTGDVAGGGGGVGVGGVGGAGGAAPAPPDGKRAGELKVMELRQVLESKHLDRTGNKATLLDRLTQALISEGQDPETYLIRVKVNDKIKTTPTTPSKIGNSRSSSITETSEPEQEREHEQEQEHEVEREHEERDEMLVKREIVTPDSARETRVTDKEEKTSKRPADEDGGDGDLKKPCVRQQEEDGAEKSLNGMDTEDSINIDLAEDELLNEEGEGGAKIKDGTGAGATEAAAQESRQDVLGEQSEQQTDAENQDSPSRIHTDAGDKKDDKGNSSKSTSSSRNLWVSRLSSLTRARDLKQLCSRYGKVIGAKVVTNARTPGSQCYGYVTMATAHQADDCIKHLDKSELHGRIIYMEKAKSELGSGNTTTENPWNQHKSADVDQNSFKTEKRDESDKSRKSKSQESKVEKSDDKKVDKSQDSDKARSERSKSKKESEDRRRGHERERNKRERSPRRNDVLSFNKIRRERELQRAREETRRARSEERRRRAAEQSLREMERRHRLEKQRLAMESEKLRMEMERIKHEKEMVLRMRKNENLEREQQERLEREKQKLEWEKLHIAKLELKRARMRLIDDDIRRPSSSTKTSFSSFSSKSSAAAAAPAPASGAVWSKPLPPPPPTFSQTEKSRFPPAFDSAPSSAYPEKRSSDTRNRDHLEKRRDYASERGYSSDKRASDSRAGASGGRGGGHSWHGSGGSSNAKYSSGSNNASYDNRQPLPPGTQSREERYGDRENNYDNSYHSSSQRNNNSYKEHRYADSSARQQPRIAPSESGRSGSGWAAKSSSSSHNWSKSNISGEWSSSGGGGGGVSTTNPFYSSDYGGGAIKYPLHQPAPPGSSPFHENAYQQQQQRGDYRQKY